MKKVDITNVLEEIAEDISPIAKTKHLEITTDIPTDLPAILGDKVRLIQVFKNLIDNAIKFTDHGKINLAAQNMKEYIVVSIEDTGVGISKEELKKVFKKFYQAYTGEDRKNEGTGLGLFISKEIVAKHNGEIYAESCPGKGSKFIVKFPSLPSEVHE